MYAGTIRLQLLQKVIGGCLIEITAFNFISNSTWRLCTGTQVDTISDQHVRVQIEPHEFGRL